MRPSRSERRKKSADSLAAPAAKQGGQGNRRGRKGRTREPEKPFEPVEVPDQPPQGIVETIKVAADKVIERVKRVFIPLIKSHKELIINAELLESRVAVLEEGTLEEFTIERNEEHRLVGSIYKGVVKNLKMGSRQLLSISVLKRMPSCITGTSFPIILIATSRLWNVRKDASKSPRLPKRTFRASIQQEVKLWFRSPRGRSVLGAPHHYQSRHSWSLSGAAAHFRSIGGLSQDRQRSENGSD